MHPKDVDDPAAARHVQDGVPVDTMALTRRLVRSVVEDMTEMSPTTGTPHLGAHHAERAVGMQFQRPGLDLLKERRPPATGVKLVICPVQRGSAADTMERAGAWVIEVPPRAAVLRPGLPKDAVFQRRKDLTPLGSRQRAWIERRVERGVNEWVDGHGAGIIQKRGADPLPGA